MRDAETFREHDAGRGVALVVGLEAGEHEVELLVGHRGRERVGNHERVGRAKRVVLHVDRAVRATGERLTDHLLHARGARRTDDDFSTVFLAQPQRLFEGVGIRLVHLVADILLANPRLVVLEARLPLAGGHLLDAHCNLHGLRA